jgi:hypothetical protein
VGYDVAVEDVRQVSAAVAAAGNNGSISSMFYAEVRLVWQCWVVAGNTLLLTVTSPKNSTSKPVRFTDQDTVPAPLWQAQHCRRHLLQCADVCLLSMYMALPMQQALEHFNIEIPTGCLCLLCLLFAACRSTTASASTLAAA